MVHIDGIQGRRPPGGLRLQRTATAPRGDPVLCGTWQLHPGGVHGTLGAKLDFLLLKLSVLLMLSPDVSGIVYGYIYIYILYIYGNYDW